MTTNNFALHRINFYNYTPVSFTCLARSSSGLIAAGKSDGSLDVYDETRDFFLVHHLPSSILQSVEAVVWLGDSRLFATGTTGLLSELDLDSGCVKVGNDEGFVTKFAVDANGITPKLTLKKLSGKIISLAVDIGRNLVAVGTSSGLIAMTICHEDSFAVDNLLQLESVKDPCDKAWCLLFLNNGLLLSGHDCGRVRVWGRHGHMYSLAGHQADVLCLVTPDVGDSRCEVFFSGSADGTVRKYRLTLDVWELSSVLRGNRRDVLGLALIPGRHYQPGQLSDSLSEARFEPHRLLAVGRDCRIQLLACETAEQGLSSASGPLRTPFAPLAGVGKLRVGAGLIQAASGPFWPCGLAPLRPPPSTAASLGGDDQRFLLLHYPNRMALVQLGRPVMSRLKRHRRLVPLTNGLLQLAEIKSKKGQQLLTSCLSPNGRFIAYSDMTRTRLLKVEQIDNSSQVSGKRRFQSVTVRPVDWLIRRSSKLAVVTSKRSRKLTSSPSVKSTTTSSSETDDTDNDDLLLSTCIDEHQLFQLSAVEGHLEQQGQMAHQVKAKEELMGASIALAFTSPDKDSPLFLRIDRARGDLIAVEVGSGQTVWTYTDCKDQARAYQLTATDRTGDDLIAVACRDGRVRLIDSASGHLCGLIPCQPSLTGRPPLPVAMCFNSRSLSSSTSDQLAVLYTDNRVGCWSLERSPADDQRCRRLDLHFNARLDDFCLKMSEELQLTIGSFHSLSFINEHMFLLATNDYLVKLDTQPENYHPGLVRRLLDTNAKSGQTKDPCCISIVKGYQTIIQAHAFNSEELAIVSLDSASLAANLTAPLLRKRFGT